MALLDGCPLRLSVWIGDWVYFWPRLFWQKRTQGKGMRFRFVGKTKMCFFIKKNYMDDKPSIALSHSSQPFLLTLTSTSAILLLF